MKALLSIILLLFGLQSFCQEAVVEDTTRVKLIRIYPEPFHEVLHFEFKVLDEKHHPASIHIMNTRDELIFFESVLLYKNHEKITVNSIDFFDVGLYSIKVEVDKKIEILKKFKRY